VKGTVKPLPNALSAFPNWIRRSAAPIAVVTLTSPGREALRPCGSDPDLFDLKTSEIKFLVEDYTPKGFSAMAFRVILGT
jgi:hypothetical protein